MPLRNITISRVILVDDGEPSILSSYGHGRIEAGLSKHQFRQLSIGDGRFAGDSIGLTRTTRYK